MPPPHLFHQAAGRDARHPPDRPAAVATSWHLIAENRPPLPAAPAPCDISARRRADSLSGGFHETDALNHRQGRRPYRSRRQWTFPSADQTPSQATDPNVAQIPTGLRPGMRAGLCVLAADKGRELPVLAAWTPCSARTPSGSDHRRIDEPACGRNADAGPL